MAEQQEKGKMITLGGLWKAKTGSSLSGFFGDAKIVVYKNTQKTDPKQPDYKLAIAEKPRQQGQYKAAPKNYAPKKPQPPAQHDSSDDFIFGDLE